MHSLDDCYDGDTEDDDVTDTNDSAVIREFRDKANARIDNSDVRQVERDGRDYLVFPIIAARGDMVLNYPENGTKEFLPADSLTETADMWSGTPLTYVHPENRRKTAAEPESYTGEHIGEAHNPEIVDGDKLRVEGWVDVEKARAIGGMASDVVEKLNGGNEVSVSAGYATLNDLKTNGTHDGETYNVKQGTVIPDHIAVFPTDAPMTARCSPEDGCAAPRANAMEDEMTDEITDDHAKTLGYRFMEALGMKTNSEDDCGCGGACDECGDVVTNAEEGDEGDSDDPPEDDPDDDSGEDEDDDQPDDEPNTMSDDKINELAEHTSFDAETLEDWSDEELEALEDTVSEFDADEDDGGTDPQPDEDPDEDDDNGSDEDEPSLAEVKQNYEEIKQQNQQLQETVEKLAEEKETEEKRDDARIVANALDIETEEALGMESSTLEKLADKHRDDVQTVNYGAVPGEVNRTNAQDETEEYPAGGRSAWEQRQESD